jgi:hypothetical protein
VVRQASRQASKQASSHVGRSTLWSMFSREVTQILASDLDDVIHDLT